MDKTTAELLDQIHGVRSRLKAAEEKEKDVDIKIGLLQTTKSQLREVQNLIEDELNKFELNLRAALAGTPSPVEVPPPVTDEILDQVGREG